MAISLQSLQKNTAGSKPPRILTYGTQGIGKTGMLVTANAPVIIPTEDGLGKYDVDHYPLCRSYTDVMDCLTSLATENHNFKTVGVDSLDWMEPLIWAKVAQDGGKKSIEDIGYGKGYVLALDYWREYLDALNYLRDTKGMTVIQTAHAEIKRFDSPETESYDKYFVKLHKSAAGLVQEHSDCVLFINYLVTTKNSKVGFDKDKTRAVGAGERYIYTTEKPAFHAKNRYGLPDRIPFDKEGNYWGVLAQHIPSLYQAPQPQLVAAQQ
jgi:hypothetical protein